MSSDQEIQAFDALLKAFDQVPERLPTFLEITRYPHYENVCSNILEFLLDPKKPHGLGTLFLDALGRVGKIEDQPRRWDNVEVTREEYTTAGNRIDILILSDSHAVLIENKIWRPSDNPFRDYAEHIKCLPRHHKHKLLLTLKPDVGGTAQQCGFENVTHEQLVNEVRELLGTYVTGADTRYLTFMLDFLNTLENLREGMVMNPELVEFLQSRQVEVEGFHHQIEAFKGELRRKVSDLKGHFRYNSKSDPNVEKPGLWRERSGLCDVLYFKVKHPSFQREIQVDVIISPEGWTVHIFPWQGSELRQLEGLLDNLQIQIKKEEDGRFTLEQSYEYADPDLDRIAREVEEVLERLSRSAGRR